MVASGGAQIHVTMPRQSVPTNEADSTDSEIV
jgi:hypothetical protein